MSKAQDKRTVSEEIQYLKRAISGLRYTISSASTRALAIDSEIVALQEKRARLLADAELAPALLAPALKRLSDLEALDFLNLSTVKARATPQQKVARRILLLRLEIARLSEELDRFAQ